MPEPADFPRLLRSLVEANVKFIVVGGMAMVSHGSAFLTVDLDICYERSPENLEALASSLAPFHPYLRGAPPGFLIASRGLWSSHSGDGSRRPDTVEEGCGS